MPRGKANSGVGVNDDVNAFGDWPNINLIMIDSTDYGEVPDAVEGSTSPMPVITPKRVLRIHIDIPIDDLTIYDDVRKALAGGKRKDAHDILEAKGLLKTEKARAKALIKAALVDKDV